jgi:hypothetical protein
MKTAGFGLPSSFGENWRFPAADPGGRDGAAYTKRQNTIPLANPSLRSALLRLEIQL